MRRIEFKDIGLVVLWALFILFVVYSNNVSAQDNEITVCRDVDYGPLRFEFQNMPANWFEWNSDAPAWNYWAEGVYYDIERGVMIADPLTVDTDGRLAGTVVLVNYTDDWTLVGDENTAACGGMATITPISAQNAANDRIEPFPTQSMVGAGRTCTIKYPQIILVCNDGY